MRVAGDFSEKANLLRSGKLSEAAGTKKEKKAAPAGDKQ